jgi:ABC-type transporter Mla subunit MlaD
MSSRSRVLVLFALALLMASSLLAATGCGKSDKQKVTDDVNGICKDFRKDTSKLFDNVDNLKQFAKQGRKAIPAVDRTGRRLATVKASKDVREDLGKDYTRFVATFQRTAAAFGAAVASAEAGDKRKFNQYVNEIDRLDKQGNRQARKLGFDECAKS